MVNSKPIELPYYEALNFEGLERRANYRVIAYREDMLYAFDKKDAAATLYHIIYRWQTEVRKPELFKEIERRKRKNENPLTPEEVEDRMFVYMSYNSFVRECGGAIGYNTVIRTLDYLVNTVKVLNRRDNHDPSFSDYEYSVNKDRVREMLQGLPVFPPFVAKLGKHKPKLTGELEGSTQMGTANFSDDCDTQMGTATTQMGTATTQMGTATTQMGRHHSITTDYPQDISQKESVSPSSQQASSIPHTTNVDVDLTHISLEELEKEIIRKRSLVASENVVTPSLPSSSPQEQQSVLFEIAPPPGVEPEPAIHIAKDKPTVKKSTKSSPTAPPTVPEEIPFEKLPWDAKKAIATIERMVGKKYRSREKELKFCEKILNDYHPTEETYIRVVSKILPWYKNHERLLHPSDLAANTPRGKVRFEELLEDIEYQDQDQSGPSPSVVTQSSPESSESSMSHDEAVQLATDAVEQGKLYGHGIEASVYAKGDVWLVQVTWDGDNLYPIGSRSQWDKEFQENHDFDLQQQQKKAVR